MDYFNLVIAALALFISGLVAYWQFIRKPKLEIHYRDSDPYRKFLIPENRRKDYGVEWFVRAKIKNSRKVIAKNCFAKIIEWYTNNEKVTSFDPIKLHWVSNIPSDYSSINLSFEEFDYVDLFFTQKDIDKIKLYTNTHARGIPIEFNMRDTHYFKLVAYCENEAHRFEYFKVWYLNEDPEGKLRFPMVKIISEKQYKKLE